MTVYKYFLFEGGHYKQEELTEFVEDVGGYILQRNVIGVDLILQIAVPEEEVENLVHVVRHVVKGKIKEAPLVGSEIAVVSPTVTRHHLPHPTCDIAEYLRRFGAKTYIIGLARGVGIKNAHITAEEKRIIEEFDIAVFVLGNFLSCLKRKAELLADFQVPVVVTGAPEVEEFPNARAYVGGIGRIVERFRTGDMIAKLDRLVEAVGRVLDEKRRELEADPPAAPPVMVKAEIEKQIPEVEDILSPYPVTLKLDGVRIKLPYDEYADKVKKVVVGGRRLYEIAEVVKSRLHNYILVKLLPESMVGTAI